MSSSGKWATITGRGPVGLRVVLVCQRRRLTALRLEICPYRGGVAIRMIAVDKLGGDTNASFKVARPWLARPTLRLGLARCGHRHRPDRPDAPRLLRH